MRYLLLIASAVDAATAVLSYQNHLYWWGFWLSALSGGCLVLAMKLGDKENDETTPA